MRIYIASFKESKRDYKECHAVLLNKNSVKEEKNPLLFKDIWKNPRIFISNFFASAPEESLLAHNAILVNVL